ncbi:MAG: hypothetical protein UZ20_WS6002000782 [candidate division WS6 bacterium OLB21]|uniref:Uncharacterized protein n=1 Tax=candidate division WS6 bacterium OLB21 TaxID=1617427 RepID=A0A136KFR7_9BACT|nr:MAG: hypothetical protein UZ20_WS6002000782 [candidate division WS6 bacterium OLB21]
MKLSVEGQFVLGDFRIQKMWISLQVDFWFFKKVIINA